jgi:DNA-binding NtrC family response regulator
VRELENVLQRSMVMAGGTLIELEDLAPQVRDAKGLVISDGVVASSSLPIPPDFFSNFDVPLAGKMEQLAEIFEKKLIVHALEQNNGHRQDTADQLGISRKSLHNKMAKYELFDREEAGR